MGNRRKTKRARLEQKVRNQPPFKRPEGAITRAEHELKQLDMKEQTAIILGQEVKKQ